MQDADEFFAELDREDMKWENILWSYFRQQKKTYAKQENGEATQWSTSTKVYRGIKTEQKP